MAMTAMMQAHMGEAKRRGNRERRVADAIASHPDPEAVRVQMGFPEAAEFRGYVVCLPDSGEFLAGTVRAATGVSIFKYGPTPDSAQKWATYRLAERAAGQIEKHRSDVGYLYDSGKQYLLGFANSDSPSAKLG
jgi:hypothetical protein